MGVLREILDSREEKYFSITPTHEKHKNRRGGAGKAEPGKGGTNGGREKGEMRKMEFSESKKGREIFCLCMYELLFFERQRTGGAILFGLR